MSEGVEDCWRFIVGQAEAQRAAEKLGEILEREGILHAVIGTLALNESGYRCVTLAGVSSCARRICRPSSRAGSGRAPFLGSTADAFPGRSVKTRVPAPPAFIHGVHSDARSNASSASTSTRS